MSASGVPRPRLHGDRPQRLLVVTAHPDDAEVAVAGSVAAWVRDGTLAHLVCCTSGDAGSDDAATDPLELAALREQEQRAAAGLLGYEAVTFLHRPDGALANDLALREQLVRLIRGFRPDAVASADPRVVIDELGVVQHVDHREAAAAAVDAVEPAARNAMTFTHLARSEGLAPHRVDRLYLFWSSRPTDVVDIGATIEQKLSALREHASQRWRLDRLEARVRDLARAHGALVGIQTGEAYAVIDLQD